MNKIAIIPFLALCFAGCSVNSFDLPISNKTNLASIECKPWIETGNNLYKSTCLIDNANGNEKRPLELAVYNETGRKIGNAFIGIISAGEKLKLNKAITLEGKSMPATVVLDVSR